MENKAFKDSDSWYYNVEKDILYPYIPEGPNIILDIGCGSGMLGRNLLKLNKAESLIGVEIYKPAAIKAEKYYNKVYNQDIEQLNLEYHNYFDFIICGDILEHLKDPWIILKKIRNWLKRQGNIIITIPNIRYWYILKELMLKGIWKYSDAGILDKTHLRFFTRRTINQIIREEKYILIISKMIIHGKKKNVLNKLTYRFFEEFLGSQILVIAKK